MISPLWLALFYAMSEVAISKALRSKTPSAATDKGSLRLIWIVVNLGVVAAILCWRFAPMLTMSDARAAYKLGVAIFVFGLALRWYSIAYLGRSFTVDVTVRADQSVIDTGPYRLIRHPSYAGSLLAFYGLGLCFGNYGSLAFLALLPTAVFLYRIRLEETVLAAGLGESYRAYMVRTKKLIPYLY